MLRCALTIQHNMSTANTRSRNILKFRGLREVKTFSLLSKYVFFRYETVFKYKFTSVGSISGSNQRFKKALVKGKFKVE